MCMSSSVKKGHQIGCEIHHCHQTHGNNKKEFDSLLGHDFATNLKDKSLVNDRKNQCTGSQMMAKNTRTCILMDPNKLCKLCLTICKDQDADMFHMKGGQGNCCHQHHDPRNDSECRVRSTDLAPEIQKMVADLKEPSCSSSQVQQCVKSQTSLTLPDHQIICL